MVLYVDETASDNFFIVTGLLANSKEDVSLAFKRFKKWVREGKLTKKEKASLFVEFKSIRMDRTYQTLKKEMLTQLNKINHCVIYSCCIVKNSKFSQKEKERAYINLISRIASSLDSDNVDVYFDSFNKNDFETAIIKKLKSFSHVNIAVAVDSQKEVGIQFADNLCSVVRLYKTGRDENGFYEIIKPWLKEV